jgi:hypothetical protein
VPGRDAGPALVLLRERCARVPHTDLIATVPRNLATTFVKSWKLRLVQPPFQFPSFDVTQYWHQRYDQEPGNVWLRNLLESISRDVEHAGLAKTAIQGD